MLRIARTRRSIGTSCINVRVGHFSELERIAYPFSTGRTHLVSVRRRHCARRLRACVRSMSGYALPNWVADSTLELEMPLDSIRDSQYVRAVSIHWENRYTPCGKAGNGMYIRTYLYDTSTFALVL